MSIAKMYDMRFRRSLPMAWRVNWISLSLHRLPLRWTSCPWD